MNHPQDFKVYRTRENDPDGPQDWRQLRKGVADMHRRAAICQAANNRYAEGLAATKDQKPLKEWTDPLCQRALAPGKNPQRRRLRALNPLSPDDAGLLEAVLDLGGAECESCNPYRQCSLGFLRLRQRNRRIVVQKR